MAEAKMKENDASVQGFLNKVEDEQKRDDSYEIIEIMKEVTGEEARMWGPSIIGFGRYHYKYESGREGDAPLAGFSPRKQSIVVYLMDTLEQQTELLEKLGKYKTSKACLYIKRLSDVNVDVLRKLIKIAADEVSERYK